MSRLNRLKRRDRLDHAFCIGEPENPVPACQLMLDQAYILKNERRIREVAPLLAEYASLQPLPYQEARAKYLLGQYCEAMEDDLDWDATPYDERTRDFRGEAVEHYARGADIAREIPDKALYAQFRALESKAHYYSHPRRKRYRRAFEAAREALDVWERLPSRKIATDMAYGFKLGDLLGLTAGVVGEDVEAVRGLEYAAHRLFDLQHRPDADPAQFANDELFLDWDWTHLLYTTGHYRRAFTKAREIKKKGNSLFTARNRVRFQAHIAKVLLACAEEGKVGDYSRTRLLAASDRAIHEAYEWETVCQKNGEDDRAAHALILLAEAKWMGMSRNPRTQPEDRIAKIEEAQRIATARDDVLLLGQIEIAWGDEFAVQFARRPARWKRERVEQHYNRAIEILRDVEAECLARTAEQRLERFRNPPAPQPPLASQATEAPEKPPYPRRRARRLDPSHN